MLRVNLISTLTTQMCIDCMELALKDTIEITYIPLQNGHQVTRADFPIIHAVTSEECTTSLHVQWAYVRTYVCV